MTPVTPGYPELWRDIEVADFRRRAMKGLLATRAATPHAAMSEMVAIRRLLAAALDEEWIEFDPTLAIKWRPEYIGHRS